MDAGVLASFPENLVLEPYPGNDISQEIGLGYQGDVASLDEEQFIVNATGGVWGTGVCSPIFPYQFQPEPSVVATLPIKRYNTLRRISGRVEVQYDWAPYVDDALAASNAALQSMFNPAPLIFRVMVIAYMPSINIAAPGVPAELTADLASCGINGIMPPRS